MPGRHTLLAGPAAAAVLHVEGPHGPIHVPPPGGVVGRRVPDVVDEAQAPAAGRRGAQVGGPDGGAARRGDEAHGGEGEAGGGRQGADEAGQGGGGRARRRGQVHVHVGDEGRRGPGHEDGGDDAAGGD